MSRLHVRQIATKIIELFGNKVDISDIQDPQSEEGFNTQPREGGCELVCSTK